MTSLLESVPDVAKATTSFEDKISIVKAKGDLCKENGQKPLLDSLEKGSYKGKVISVK